MIEKVLLLEHVTATACRKTTLACDSQWLNDFADNSPHILYFEPCLVSLVNAAKDRLNSF